MRPKTQRRLIRRRKIDEVAVWRLTLQLNRTIPFTHEGQDMFVGIETTIQSNVVRASYEAYMSDYMGAGKVEATPHPEASAGA